MKRIVVPFSIVLIVITAFTVGTLAQPKEMKHELKIIYDGNLVYQDEIKENEEIKIKSANNDDIEHFKMNKPKKIKLEEIDIAPGKIISYWEGKETENSFEIKPVLIEESDVNLTFTTSHGGSIKMSSDTNIPTIVISVEKGIMLKDVLPDIEIMEKHEFLGWYTIEEKEIEIENKKEKGKNKKKGKKKKTKTVNEFIEVVNINTTEITDNQVFHALFYPDINNNKKDDRNEKINLKVDFGLYNEKVTEKIHVGQPIKLGKLFNDEYIFIDWYLDPSYQEKYDGQTIMEDTTIYARWEKPNEIINQRKLITDKRVSDELENYLHKKNNKIYRKSKQETEKEVQKQKENMKKEVVKYTEKRHVYKNYKTNQSFIVKFYNEDDFLFSVGMPYGNTIEMYHENQKIKEYSIRQNTTIRLNELINVSDNISFKSDSITRNNANILRIYTTNNKEMN